MHLDVIARLKLVQKIPTEVGQTAPDSRTVSGFTRAGVIWESVLTMTWPPVTPQQSSKKVSPPYTQAQKGRSSNSSPQRLLQGYHQSVLTDSITSWFRSCRRTTAAQ